MALLADFKVPGPFPPVQAYYMVSGILHNRIANTVLVHLALFRDADSRNSYKAQSDNVRKGKADAVTAQMARSAAVDNTTAAEAELGLAKAQFAINQAVGAMEALNPLLDQVRATIQDDKIESVMTNGAVDVAKVYAVLKTFPQFANAADA